MVKVTVQQGYHPFEGYKALVLVTYDSGTGCWLRIVLARIV